MKILVLGATGMAGHIIYDYLKQNKYEVYGTKQTISYSNNIFQFNALNDSALIHIINYIKPDVVINCIGILIDESIKNPKIASYINGFFPHRLDLLSEQYRFNLIHLSTDCVFDGKEGNYTSSDIPNSTSWYGITKAIGEIRNNNPNSITIRTSIIGRELKNKKGLMEWFLSQDECNECNGYTNHIWSGVTTLELAKQIEKLIQIGCYEKNIIQLASNPISKYDLLEVINHYYREVPIKIIPIKVEPINRSMISNIKNIPCHKDMIMTLKEYKLEHIYDLVR